MAKVRDGSLDGAIEAHKFARYIKPEDAVLDFGCGGGIHACSSALRQKDRRGA